MSSRHHMPLSCRLPVSHRATVVRIAAQRGMTVSSLIKEALKPYIDGVHLGVNEQFVMNQLSPYAVPLRPVIAPANRARVDSPVRSGGGFRERQK